MTRVLVIDDEPGVQRAIGRFLRHAGDFEVTAAFTGDAGLELLGAEQFDVVLLDLAMPGLTGLEVLDRMALDHPPVIVMSGAATKKERDTAIAQGCRGFIDKPYDAATLTAEIRRVLKDL